MVGVICGTFVLVGRGDGVIMVHIGAVKIKRDINGTMLHDSFLDAGNIIGIIEIYFLQMKLGLRTKCVRFLGHIADHLL